MSRKFKNPTMMMPECDRWQANTNPQTLGYKLWTKQAESHAAAYQVGNTSSRTITEVKQR